MTKLGFVLPTTLAGWADGEDPRALVDLAVEAERLGFDSVWVGDTLLRPVVEPLTTLAAVAAVTRTIGLGTATLLPAFRRPVQAAHTIASLDRLSGGRLTLAVGAGFPNRSEREYALSDVPWEGRFVRLDDTVALWRRLWAGDPETPVLPPARKGGPPIWLGGASPSALKRVARSYDGWLPYPPDPSAYAAGLAAIGRPVTAALFATVLIGDGGRRALDAYTRAAYGMPLAVVETIQLLVAGSAEQVRERLAEYAGVEHLVLRVAAPDLATQREQLALLRPGT
jgi:alkanesulfonate monooxygenase SsuD/methylene tetrahydromethanopterin reductase-like flavin-dependent oxidoreductase (luciferase family)